VGRFTNNVGWPIAKCSWPRLCDEGHELCPHDETATVISQAHSAAPPGLCAHVYRAWLVVINT